MRWRRVDRVQPVSALIATGPGAPALLASAMAGKAAILRALPVAHGRDWAAIFSAPAGASGADADALLPSLPGTTALYEAAKSIWLPVGVALDVPAHLNDALLNTLFDEHRLKPPAIIVPRFAGTEEASGEADLYPFDRMDRLEIPPNGAGDGVQG